MSADTNAEQEYRDAHCQVCGTDLVGTRCPSCEKAEEQHQQEGAK